MHITPFIFAFVIMLFLKTVHTGPLHTKTQNGSHVTLTILYYVVHLKMEVKDWYIQFFIPPSLGTVHGPGHKDKCIETYLR